MQNDPAAGRSREVRRTLSAVWYAAGYRDKNRPAELDAAGALTDAEFRLWVLYRAHDHDGDGTFVGERLLASEMQRSVSAIQKIRVALHRKGYLLRRLNGPKEATWKAIVPGMDTMNNEVQP